MVHGIINVYKEKGFTSHDVVAKMRGIVGQKKIGHTGTLDPEATGVLPVCLGVGTRLCDMLTDKSKEYVATLKLGVVTDTQDITGAIIKEAQVHCGEEEIRDVIMSFVGSYDQVPPMYSAVKIDGKRLYELARQGKEVERQARRVEIYSIDLPGTYDEENHQIQLRVRCSKGTYIRTLCHDIGEKLLCGGVMASLERTASGPFTLRDAHTLAEIQQFRDEGKLSEIITPVDQMFAELPAVTVKPHGMKLLLNGNVLPAETAQSEGGLTDGGQYRMYDEKSVFYGIYRYFEKERLLKPEKMFICSL